MAQKSICSTFDLISDYFCFVLPKNQQFLTYPVAGVGNKGLEKGKRRINWLWYKPVTIQEYNDILTGKSVSFLRTTSPPTDFTMHGDNQLSEFVSYLGSK